MQVDKMESLNVLGTELEECGVKPVTGFFRDGSCNTNKQDVGSHLCARRWLEALKAGKAPRVRIRATHQACLQVLSLDDLKQYANDLS